MTQVRSTLVVILVAAVVIGAVLATLALGYALAASPRDSLARAHCPGNDARIGKTNLCR
jgi:hypothetical protein